MDTVGKRREAFRALHDKGFLVLPNAWDVGSAVRLAALGFKAVGSTSAGAAWAAGREDGGLTLDETLVHLQALVVATTLPVSADFENGFAHAPEGVARNVALAAATGVAGLSIEDWSGTEIYELNLAVERIAAARAALNASDPRVMLVGRHENFRCPGLPIGDSVARAVAYAEAGADCLFVPFILDRGEVAELVAAVAPKPVNVVVHDYDDIPDLRTLGVRRVSVGGSLARAAWSGFDAAARHLQERSC